MNLKIYIISLEKNKERQHIIAKRMMQLGLDFEFFFGVDGSSLTQAELAQVDQKYCHEHFNHEMNPSEVGCAMSHIRIYENMVSDNISHALILEDDAYLLSCVPDILSSIMKRPRFDMLYLFHGKAKRWPLSHKLPHDYRLVRYRSPTKKSKRCIIGAVAYIISINGAKKLLNHAYPIRMPADYLTGLIQKNDLIAYGVEPNCVDTGHLDTTIPGRNYGTHIE
ncbi:glycosyltransferase family 25 protein [Aeromonas enteropelogenes]|uniref:glycosyltransferase family 25 protein n=1 Tax=Aeromonas enteropelogenes TaxID=29489 RepID=UPI003F7426F4